MVRERRTPASPEGDVVDGEALLFQELAQTGPEQVVVIDEQHSQRRHVSVIASFWRQTASDGRPVGGPQTPVERGAFISMNAS
jgi:hypothetical protein